MPLIFLFAVFAYIYAEISLLVSLGSSIGVLSTILLMIAISVAGLWLVKLRGLMTLWQIRQDLAAGKMPTEAVISSLFFALAGVLLIIPGILSDILAILLILPFTRQFLEKPLLNIVKSKMVFGFSGFRSSAHTHESGVFDAEFERKPQDQSRLK